MSGAAWDSIDDHHQRSLSGAAWDSIDDHHQLLHNTMNGTGAFGASGAGGSSSSTSTNYQRPLDQSL